MNWRSLSITTPSQAAPPPLPPLPPHPPPLSSCPSSPRSRPPRRSARLPPVSAHPKPWILWRPRLSSRRTQAGRRAWRWRPSWMRAQQAAPRRSLRRICTLTARMWLPSPSSDSSLLLAVSTVPSCGIIC